MRIDHLHLKGVTCFAGDVNLDFTQIPPGLVAIVGPNGAGKTSLMESMVAAIYRHMPTRGPVLDYATGKDSFVDVGVTFDQAGSFRARLNLDGVNGASDAVLERVVDGRSQRLSDGKVKTFDAAVKDIFPPLDALLASAFAAQNRMGSFATRNKTERKDLFYTLLGLHQLDGYATTARAIVNVLEKRLAELRGRRDALQEHVSDELVAQLQDQAGALNADLAAAAREVRSLTDLLASYEDVVLAPYRAEVKRLSGFLSDRARLEAAQTGQQETRRHAVAALEEMERDFTREKNAEVERGQSALANIDRAEANLASEDEIRSDEASDLSLIRLALDRLRRDTQARIDKNRGLKDRADVIRAADATLKRTCESVARLERELQGALQAHAADPVSKHITAAETSVRRLQGLIEERTRAQRSADLLTTVPCGGAGDFASCAFLQDANTAKGRLAELIAEDLDGRLNAAQQALATLLDSERHEQSTVAQLRESIDRENREVASVRSTAELLPHLEAAEERIAEHEKTIADAVTKAGQDESAARAHTQERLSLRQRTLDQLSADRQQANATLDLESREIDARYAGRQQQCTQRLQDLDASLAAIAADLTATAGAKHEHEQAELALAAAIRRQGEQQQLLTDAGISHARLEEQVAIVRRRREECEQRRGDHAKVTALITTIETDLIDWQALAQVMGRDGLPVLEIDAAGPGVSAEANDLLQVSFGGRFLVELVTQELKADGKGMKEVFELKVYDHERGGEERDLSDLSGGEQVIVDEALKSAIALFVNRRNDRPIRTCWRDETTGALDPENAQRYVAMLRRLHERAGLHHLFFVSHNHDVSAQADAQLQVHDGQVTVAYPPFVPLPANKEAA